MKIKVGDYIRDNNGIIAKVSKTSLVIIEAIINTGETKLYLKEKISKASENIIDLIEVGDIIKVDNYDFIKVFRVENKEFSENRIKDDGYKILSILTHEQYEQNVFRTEGE